MKIGLWGGTFDPVHHGHLAMMRESAKAMQFDKVIVLPAHIPPHKQPEADSQQRLAMLRLALADDTAFVIDTRELEAEQVSYSVHSCRQLTQEYAEHDVYFCMGADSFARFDTWHCWQDILACVNLVVVSRPGYQPVNRQVESFHADNSSRLKTIDYLHLSLVDVSSTQIRAALRRGDMCRSLIPETVLQFIQRNNLYL